MDFLGVFMILLGAYLLTITIAGIAGNPAGGTATVWFLRVAAIGLGVYCLYHGYTKVVAPPPTLLGQVTGAVTGGRRRY
jgi:hypothetical protein